jgi:hypothetical protein
MDNKKFEQLINLIINEDEEQARALFHDIVVEKSREIYEGMMDDEMQEGMGGQVGDLLDEINAEEAGGMTEDDEADIEFDDEAEEDGEDLTHDLEADVEGDAGENLEDRVVDLEDKLDQLMAEFEDIMGGEGEEDMGGEEDFGGEEEFGGEEDMGGEEAMMEAVQLKQVGGQTYNKYGNMGDNGAQTKSPSLVNSGQAGMDSKPVKFSGASESVPTSPKAPNNAYTKGETSVKGAGSFKNAPAQNNFSEKGESTPKPVTKDEAGKVRSPVAESRNTPAKRRI